jgi:hypothetical protein
MKMWANVARNGLAIAAGMLIGGSAVAFAGENCNDGTPLCWWYENCEETCTYKICEHTDCHAGPQPRECGLCERVS